MDKFDRSLLFIIFLFLLFFSLSNSYWWVLVLIVLVFNFIFFRLKLLAIFVLVALTFVRFWYFNHNEFSHFAEVFSDSEVYDLNIRICGEPDVRLEFANYIVCVEEFNEARLLLKSDLYPSYKFGDSFFVSGKIEEAFESEEFSYKDYLKIFRVEGVLNPVSGLKFIDSENSFKRNLFDFKFKLLDIVESNINEPYASLMNGLLFGARKGFTDEVNNMLTITGLTHIVAVSGYNVSLVILFVERILFFIPRNIRFYILILVIFLFAIIASMSASVLRACIMGSISIMALQFGYAGNLLRAILLTAVGMILWNPASLYFDLGFQLSFYATLGVLYISNFLKLEFVTEKFALRDSLKLTLASQAATLPTILYFFGNLSLVSPLANLLVAPFLPVLMLLGFLIIIFSKFNFLVKFLDLVTTSISNFFFLVLRFLSDIPYAMITLPLKNGIILLVIYLLLGLLLLRKSD